MTGLPYLAENIRSLLKWGLIAFVSLFGIWILWLIFSFGYKLVFPPPPPSPDVAFGKIRQPLVFNSKFPKEIFNLSTPGETIAQPSGLLNVYEIDTTSGEFTSLDDAKKVAKGASLDSEPKQLSENEWLWESIKNPSKSLKYNIVTHNFTYKYDWNSDPKSLEGVFNTDERSLINKAQTFLNNFKSLKDDLKNGFTRVTFWKIVGNDRKEVGSLSEANAAMVEFFRQNIDETSSLLEINPNRAQVNVWISPSSTTAKQILELNFVYYSYNKDKKATYPPKSSASAYEELLNGNAYIAKGFGENFATIDITVTKIAYLNPSDGDTATLQPVFVFEGKGKANGETKDFSAYVPAIDSQYLR